MIKTDSAPQEETDAVGVIVDARIRHGSSLNGVNVPRESATRLLDTQYLRCLICCPLTGKHACGGFLSDPLLFPAAGHVGLMNDRGITKESLRGSSHLSLCTDLPFPAPYILFIYLQGDHRFLQVHGVCVCMRGKVIYCLRLDAANTTLRGNE